MLEPQSMTACVIAHEQFPHQMEKGSVRGKKTGSAIRRWSEEHNKYMCVDEMCVEITSKAFRLY